MEAIIFNKEREREGESTEVETLHQVSGTENVTKVIFQTKESRENVMKQVYKLEWEQNKKFAKDIQINKNFSINKNKMFEILLGS